MMLKGCILDFTGIPVVGRFTVKSWQHEINYILGSSTKQVLRITVQFEQQLFGIFMVTYLPTILMNILNQATNYLAPGDTRHDLIITVNITRQGNI